MVVVIGLNSTPYSVIVWYKGDKACSKTICYDKREEAELIDCLNDERSYRYMYDRAEIIREDIRYMIRKF